MRKVAPTTPTTQEPKQKRRALPKVSLQLVPRDDELREALKSLGANPNVTVTVKPSKRLSFLFEYITHRRYGDCIQEVHDDVTIASVYQAMKSPEVFRLSYWFNPTTLKCAPAAEPTLSRPMSFEQFDATAKAPTRVLYDNSNGSLLAGFAMPSLDHNSLFPSDSILFPTSKQGGQLSLAIEFDKQADQSFAGFGSVSPVHSLDLGGLFGSGAAPDGGGSSKQGAVSGGSAATSSADTSLKRPKLQ